MLFNSFQFIFFFLPVVVAGSAFLAIHHMKSHALVFLSLSSIFFYGWWNPNSVPILLVSIIFNFNFGRAILNGRYCSRCLLFFGITVNLGLLVFFKYAGFLAGIWHDVPLDTIPLISREMPLAISFFTFQQIAYLVNCYRKNIVHDGIANYGLVVSFFPHLIAGPLVDYRQMLAEFRSGDSMRFTSENISVGVSVFIIGLFKKVVLADEFAEYANPVFSAAHQGSDVSFLSAWAGAFAYSLQLYFDFSAYSDMAIGLARIFGVHLPVNFYSPYKATSIIDFWRRWHITLSHFLREYIYIPLGGGRGGALRVASSVMITMLVGGFWHGAGWNFLLWGGFHGLMLLANRAFGRTRNDNTGFSRKFISILLTFLFVTLTWVLFRADSFYAASAIYSSMTHLTSISYSDILLQKGIWFRLMVGFAIIWGLPNTMEIFARQSIALSPPSPYPQPTASWVAWAPTKGWILILATMGTWSLLNMNHVHEFIYFQF